MTSIFDEMFNFRTIPTIDLEEQLNNTKISIAVPGLKKETIDIKYEEGILEINAEYKKSGTYKLRTFLSFDATVENAKATYIDGILEITFPKIPKPANNHIIKVD